MVETNLLHVTLPIGLVVDRIEFHGTNLRLAPKPQLGGPVQMRVRISTGCLATFIESRAPKGIEGFQITTVGGKLLVEAHAKIALLKTRVSAEVSMEIFEKRMIVAHLDSCSHNIATGLIEKQLAAINPVLNVADLPVRVQLDSIQIEGNKIVILGVAWLNEGLIPR